MGKYASMGKKGKSEDAASLPGRRGTYHVHGGNTDAVVLVQWETNMEATA